MAVWQVSWPRLLSVEARNMRSGSRSFGIRRRRPVIGALSTYYQGTTVGHCLAYEVDNKALWVSPAASGKPDVLCDLLEARVGTETVKHRLRL